MAYRHHCKMTHSEYSLGHQIVHLVQLTLLTLFLCATLPSKSSTAQTTGGPLGLDEQTEIVTEIVTVYEIVEEDLTTANPDADSTDRPCNGPTPTPVLGIPGSTLVIQFAITNMNLSDIQEPSEQSELKKLLEDEFKMLYSEYDNFIAATVLGFKEGSIIVEIKLVFNEALNVQQRDQVVTTVYEKVVINGTLGALQLHGLQVIDNKGVAKNITDACDITPCFRKDMKCFPEGTSCKSTCAGNEGYCVNHSVCQKNNNFIMCTCKGENFGDRCDKVPMKPPSGLRNENAYVGIIAAAAVAVVLLLVIIVGCGYSRFSAKGKESDKSKLVPVENTVALEMLDEPPVVGGVACQTIESFLLTKYMRNGVPPKPGYQHEVIQTNESFLMAKSQREQEAWMTANTPNGTGIKHPISPVSPSSASDEQDGKTGDIPVDEPTSQEPQQEGISNEAFLEDEGEIVPTADVNAEDDDPEKDGTSGIGKKIIKV